MFDFMKRKKKGDAEYLQDQDVGRTVPLAPDYGDSPVGYAGSAASSWDGGAIDGGDSGDWYGPPGGGYGIPAEMGFAGMPPLQFDSESTVAEYPAAPAEPYIPMDSTISEDLGNPQPMEEIGATLPLVKEPEPLMGGAYEEVPQFGCDIAPAAVSMPPVAEQGCAGPSLVGLKGVLEGKRFVFRDAVLTLGVDYSCDIVLPLGTPGISRRHLRFWLDGSSPCAMDLKSTYGSFVNGEKMKPGLVYNLKTGDLLKLGGDETFRVD